jgi:hypothetical protein
VSEEQQKFCCIQHRVAYEQCQWCSIVNPILQRAALMSTCCKCCCCSTVDRVVCAHIDHSKYATTPTTACNTSVAVYTPRCLSKGIQAVEHTYIRVHRMYYALPLKCCQKWHKVLPVHTTFVQILQRNTCVKVVAVQPATVVAVAVDLA